MENQKATVLSKKQYRMAKTFHDYTVYTFHHDYITNISNPTFQYWKLSIICMDRSSNTYSEKLIPDNL